MQTPPADWKPIHDMHAATVPSSVHNPLNLAKC